MPGNNRHDSGAWESYRLLVLQELERLHNELKEGRETLHDIDKRLVRLGTIASILGAAGGIVVAGLFRLFGKG